jgi:hypothetical protein
MKRQIAGFLSNVKRQIEIRDAVHCIAGTHLPV